MKKLWAVLAGAAIVLWVSLMQLRPAATPVAPRADANAAEDAPRAASAPVAAAPPAARPSSIPQPKPAPPAATQAPQPVATSANPPAAPAESDLIPLPAPRNDRPHYTAAQARAGSPGKILANAYVHEKPDPEWSPGAEADIRKLIDGASLGPSEVFGVDCKSTVCKLQMRFRLGDREKFDGAFGKLHERFGTELGFEPLTQMDNHGQQVMRVYVMREGKTLRDYPP